MPDTVPLATSTAPASEAQTSDAKQDGASNLTATQMVQRFLKETPTSEAAPADQTTPEASSETPEPPAAETEQPAPAEAEPEVAETSPEAPETKEEADDVLSQKSSLDPKTKERIQKRIDKEVGKRKALEARLAELETKLTQPAQPPVSEDKPSIVPLPAGAPPLANIETPQGLAEIQQQAKQAIREAEDMLDVPYEQRQKLVVDGQEIEPTDQMLKRAMRNARITLEDHIPARAKFLHQRAQVQQAAHAKFPFLKDKTSQEYGMAQAIYKDMPWLRNTAQGEWIVGLGIKGYKAMQAEEAAAAKPATKPKVEPPKPPSSQAAVSAGSSVRAASDPGKGASAAWEKAKTKGGVSGSELAALLAQKELARNSR